MNKLLFCILCLFSIMLSGETTAVAQTTAQREVAVLQYTGNAYDKMDENYIRINGEKLIPPLDVSNEEYYALSMNTLQPIEITVGSETQSVKLDELSPRSYITLLIRDKRYKVFTQLSGMPSYTFKANETYDGDLYITPASASLEMPAYAYILDKGGKLVFYRANEMPPMTLSNLNRHVLKNGQIRYSVFRAFTTRILKKSKQMNVSRSWAPSNCFKTITCLSDTVPTAIWRRGK